MTTNRNTPSPSRHAQRYARQAYLVQVHRAGLAAEASVETAANRIMRRRAIRNGRRALDELLADLEGLFRHIARGITTNPDDVDDLVQIARIQALRALPTWQPGGAAVASYLTLYLWSDMKKALGRMHPYAEVVTSFDRHTVGDLGIDVIANDDIDEFLSASTAVDAMAAHRRRLTADDAHDLDEVMSDEAGATGSAWRRGRVRALLTHPTSGVFARLADGEPEPRPPTPVDIDADAHWVALNQPQLNWQLLGACGGSDPTDVFPERGVAYTDEVLERCATCPVRRDCLAAGCVESTWPGLWGGHSLKRRVAIRRAVRTIRAADANAGL